MIQAESLPLKEIGSDYYIPPKPEILVRLHELMMQSEPDIQQIADLLADDVGLSAAVLKTINSASFGMQRRVSDIRQAAILLGPQHIVSLVTTYELRRALVGDACISLERFWDSASDVAKANVFVAHKLDLRIPTEDLYAIGLFHDCGIPVLAMKYPDYQDVLIKANSNYEIPMTIIEDQHYGVNHTAVGYAIADSWDLPESICQSILQNHERDIWEVCSDTLLLQSVAVLKISENIIDRLRRQCENPDWSHHRDGIFTTLQINDTTLLELEQKVQMELENARG